MKNPKVTVIMSVYNGEKYLREAVDSVLRQTFKDFEFLIINDGSTDRTAEILQSYQDPRIKIINNEKNIGLTKSLNNGLKLAKGEYIARMDADDISMSDRLEKQIAIIEKHDNLGMVACWIKIISGNNNYVRDWQADREKNSPEEIYYTLFFENCIAHSSVLFNKELVFKIGGYDESFQKSQDYELWSRLSKITKITKIKDVLVLRREHSVNTSFDLINRHRLNEERLFLKNINTFLSDKINSYTLLSIKYNNSTWRIGENNIFNMLNTLNKINREIIKNAPSFLERRKLKECGKDKRNKIIKNAFPSVLEILKFVMRHVLLTPRYFLEYIGFFFTFKRKCSRLKVSEGKKNILCIVFSMVVGGAEKVILNIAKGTDREKFSFHTVTSIPINNVWHDKFCPYFQNIVIPTKRVASEYISNKYFYQIIKRLNIDTVLISNSLIGYKYLPQLKSEFKHIKTIDVLHAEESSGARPELEWTIPYLDRRICISESLREYMIEAYRISRIEESYIERLRVIHNGIDLREYSPNVQMKGRFKSRFGIPEDVRIISFVGRFSYEKNPLLFVDIARRIIERSPSYKLKFIMAGDGPQSDEVKNTINKYRIKDYFILTGMIDNVVELLANTYILLIVSKSEGIPFVILEAMAMKVPVISTNVGAVHEVIKDSINGYLINLEDNVVEQFICKILGLISGRLNHSELSEKARETIVSEYSLETMGVKYQNIFDGYQ